jgi:hypothetical protein
MIYYEWIVEFLEDDDLTNDDPDIYDTSAFDSYAEAAHASEHFSTTSLHRIGLTRNTGNDVEGLTDRAWSYIDPDTRQLADEFNYGGDEHGLDMSGHKVPKRFQEEIEKYHKKKGS